MIHKIGIGTDIERIDRFADISDTLLRSIFTESELNYCLPKKKYAQHLVARYCGKEAVMKALANIGVSNIKYRDIEILNNHDGVPHVVPNIKLFPEIQISISLSHSKNNAIANAIAFKNPI